MISEKIDVLDAMMCINRAFNTYSYVTICPRNGIFIDNDKYIFQTLSNNIYSRLISWLLYVRHNTL